MASRALRTSRRRSSSCLLKRLASPTTDGPRSGKPICSNSFPDIPVDVGLCHGCFHVLKLRFGPQRSLLPLAISSNRMIRVNRIGGILNNFWARDPPSEGNVEGW